MPDTKFDSYLQPKDAPIANPGKDVPWKLGVFQNLQQNRMRMSQVNVKNFVDLSGTASATGAIGNGTTLTLTTALTPNIPRQNDINYAIPYIAVYQGTQALQGNQIYPTLGGSITPGAYTVQGGLDYQAFSTAVPMTNSVWRGNITDNSAGNQNVLFVTQWRWIIYNSGTVS